MPTGDTNNIPQDVSVRPNAPRNAYVRVVVPLSFPDLRSNSTMRGVLLPRKVNAFDNVVLKLEHGRRGTRANKT